MSNMFDFLEGLEELAYKILLWIILIPKTIVQVLINPGWAPGYVKDELNKEESPFNQYVSPVILLLAVALLPALLTNFLPASGASITNGPAEPELIAQIFEDPATAENLGDRFQRFDATTNFISSSSGMEYRHSWYVEEIDEQASYREIYRENYSSNDYPVEVSRNKTQDFFYYFFDTPGEYYVNVTVEKLDPQNNIAVESYETYLYVSVPDDLAKQITVQSFSPNPVQEEAGGFSLTELPELLNKETTIFLALGLLIPPLILALATKTMTGEAISENSLRWNFYTQCYYFSPLSLAIWATYYAFYFYTPNIFFYNEYGASILALPVLFALLWFISVETQALARERNTSSFIGFMILMACIVFMLLLGGIALFFIELQDTFRVSAIWVYLLAAAALLIAGAVIVIRRKLTEKSRFTFGEIVLSGTSLFTISIFWLVLWVGETLPASIPMEEIDLTGEDAETLVIPEAVIPTEAAVPIAEQVQPTAALESGFYTEEFDGDLSLWVPFTAIGDDNRVERNVADGKLLYKLTPSNGEIPTTYLYNPSFSYTNVRLDVVATNNGNNSNAVILVCHFTDNGWYEFNISNSGQYMIYGVDSTGSYNKLTDGSSASIKAGLSTNVYTSICQGNELSLYVNGDLVESIQDTMLNRSEGSIGIGLSALQSLPVDVFIESITVSEP